MYIEFNSRQNCAMSLEVWTLVTSGEEGQEGPGTGNEGEGLPVTPVCSLCDRSSSCTLAFHAFFCM